MATVSWAKRKMLRGSELLSKQQACFAIRLEGCHFFCEGAKPRQRDKQDEPLFIKRLTTQIERILLTKQQCRWSRLSMCLTTVCEARVNLHSLHRQCLLPCGSAHTHSTNSSSPAGVRNSFHYLCSNAEQSDSWGSSNPHSKKTLPSPPQLSHIQAHTHITHVAYWREQFECEFKCHCHSKPVICYFAFILIPLFSSQVYFMSTIVWLLFVMFLNYCTVRIFPLGK